jgi:hypothetical protein
MFLVQCGVCGVKTFGPDAVENGWIVNDEVELCPEHAIDQGATPRREAAIIGFDRPEPGSAQRYDERRKARPWTAHRFWWVVHNVLSHPLIGLIPVKVAFKFHDWTSYKMHGK